MALQPRHPRIVRVLCKGCRQPLDIQAEQLGDALVCGDCGTPVVCASYPQLSQLLQEREARIQAEGEAEDKARSERMEQDRRQREARLQAEAVQRRNAEAEKAKRQR